MTAPPRLSHSLDTPSIRTFAITAMGRSGTKFLATVMNQSAIWTVAHEPRPSKNGLTARQAQPRFKRQFYGEVNSFLRFCFADLKVDRKGIILRDPHHILMSTANRGGITHARLDHLVDSLQTITRLVDRGYPLIRFERMTTDTDYLAQTLRDFGVMDIDTSSIDLDRKINASSGQLTWNDLPATLRADAQHRLLPFRERFYPNAPASGTHGYYDDQG